MSYSFNHVHLKSSDPGKTADWYVEAFGFEIVNDENPRPQGDRFIRCRTKDGVTINISGARTGELMGEGDATGSGNVVNHGIVDYDLTMHSNMASGDITTNVPG